MKLFVYVLLISVVAFAQSFQGSLRGRILDPVSYTHLVVALYAKAITPRTKVVVLSEVAYTSGLCLPLKELCDLAHNRGALVSVDGAQAFGVVPLDVKAIGADPVSYTHLCGIAPNASE